MLTFSPKQPQTQPAQDAALVQLTEHKRRLENTPDTRLGDWHPTAEVAFSAVLATETYVSRLIELRDEARRLDGIRASSDYQAAIDGLLESIGDVVALAERRAEEDAPPYNAAAYWPRPTVSL